MAVTSWQRPGRVPWDVALAIAALVAYVLLTAAVGALRAWHRSRRGLRCDFRGPISVWVWALAGAPEAHPEEEGHCECRACAGIRRLHLGASAPVRVCCPYVCLVLWLCMAAWFAVAGLWHTDFALDIDLDISSYVTDDSPATWTSLAVQTAVDRQLDTESNATAGRSGSARRLSAHLDAVQPTTPPTAHLVPFDGDEGVARSLAGAGTVVYWLTFFYIAAEGDATIFNEAALGEIREFEAAVRAFPGYKMLEYWEPDSVAGIFYRSNSDGSLGELRDIDSVVEDMVAGGVRWYVDKQFSATNRVSRYSRSVFYLTGHETWLEELLLRLHKEVLSKQNPAGGEGRHVIISWMDALDVLMNHELGEVLFHDCLWSIGAFLFIMVMLVATLRSVSLMLLGMCCIMISFVESLYFYLVVWGWVRLTPLTIVALFLGTGVAVDDMFIFFELYTHDKHGPDTPPRERFKHSYYEAGTSMLVTTATTMASFYSLLLSSLPILRSFGCFMGTVVLINYLNIMVIFTCGALAVDELSNTCCGGVQKARKPWCGGRCKRLSAAKYRFFGTTLPACLWAGRWPLLVLFPAIGAVSLWRAFEDQVPPSGLPKLFPDSHNLGRLQRLQSEAFAQYGKHERDAMKVKEDSVEALGGAEAPATCPGTIEANGVSMRCNGFGRCNEMLKYCECVPGRLGAACESTAQPARMVVQTPVVRVAAVAGRASAVDTEVVLANTGDEDLSWTISSPDAWISVQPPGGSLPKRRALQNGAVVPRRVSASVRVDISGCAARTSCTGTLDVSSSAETRAQAVVVLIDVYESMQLQNLTLDLGEVALRPPFDPSVASYEFEVPSATERVLLSVAPAAPAMAVTLTSNQSETTTGTSWFLPLPVGVTETFVVSAVVPGVGGEAGNATYTLRGRRTTLTTPGAPRLRSAVSVSAGELTVVWEPPESDGGSPVTAFRLLASPTPGSRRLGGERRRLFDSKVRCAATPCAPGGAARCCSHTLAGLDAAAAYAVEVRAVSASGEGAGSLPAMGAGGAEWPLVRPAPGAPRLAAAPVVAVHHGEVALRIPAGSLQAGGAVPLDRLTCTASPGGASATGPASEWVVVAGLSTASAYRFSCSVAGVVGAPSPPSPETEPLTPVVPPPGPPQVIGLEWLPPATTIVVAVRSSDPFLSAVACTAAPYGAGAGPAPVTGGAVAERGEEVQLRLQGLRGGSGYRIACRATNSDHARRPQAVDGPESVALELPPKPSAPVWKSAPERLGPSDELQLDLDWADDGYGPAASFECRMRLQDEDAEYLTETVAAASPVVLRLAPRGTSCEVACRALRAMPGGFPGVVAGDFCSWSAPVAPWTPASTSTAPSGSSEAPAVQELLITGAREATVRVAAGSSATSRAGSTAVCLASWQSCAGASPGCAPLEPTTGCRSGSDRQVSARPPVGRAVADAAGGAVVVFEDLPTWRGTAEVYCWWEEDGSGVRSARTCPFQPLAPPAAPSISAVKPTGDRQLSVFVDPPWDTGGWAIASYACHAEEAGLSSRLAASAAGLAPAFVFDDLAPGAAHTFTCAAAHFYGESPRSDAASATALRAPDAPSVTCLLPGDGFVEVQVAVPAADVAVGDLAATECRALRGGAAAPVDGGGVAIVPLPSGAADAVVCDARSAAGLVASSAATPEVTAGTPLIAAISIQGGAEASELDVREVVAVELGLPPARVSVGAAGADGCMSVGAAPGGRRLQAGAYELQVRVAMLGAAAGDVEAVSAGLARLPASAALSQRLGGATLSLARQPYLASQEFSDASLASLLVSYGAGVETAALAPPFNATIRDYVATVRAVDFAVVAEARSGLASVKVDGRQTPAHFNMTKVLPEYEAVSIQVTAASGRVSTYRVQVGFQARSCGSAGCGARGTCDGLVGRCSCNRSYAGDACQAYCPGACNGQGVCDMQSARCVCNTSYAGAGCDERQCPDCKHGGICNATVWRCQCAEGYTGDRCQHLLCPNNCSGAGFCDSASGECSCYEGYRGEACGIEDERKISLTKCVQVALVWGIRGYSEADASQPIYEDGFQALDPATQSWMSQVVARARAREALRCRDDWPTSLERYAPEPTGAGFGRAVRDFYATSDSERYGGDVGTDGPGHEGRVLYVRVEFKINVGRTTAAREMLEFSRAWEAFVDEVNAEAPPGARMLMTSESWAKAALEVGIIDSTVVAFASAVGINVAVLLLFTHSLRLSLVTVIVTIMVISTLLGFVTAILRWEFGAIQAVAVTSFIGISIDYSLHLSHGFQGSRAATRRLKAEDVLHRLGAAIALGGLTTLGASAFLISCKMYLLHQLGVMLVANTCFALMYTFCFQAPVLMVMGPTKRWSAVFPLGLPCPGRAQEASP